MRMVRIGLNEVLIYPETSGALTREFTLLPELLRIFEEEGWESVLYFSRDVDEGVIERLVQGRRGARAVRTPIPSLPTYRRVLRGMFHWAGAVRRDRLDLFHTSYYPVPRLDMPTVLTVYDLRLASMPETYSRARYLFLRSVIPRSLRRSDRIIAISNDTKKDIIRYFGVPAERIAVSYCPVPNRFTRIEDRSLLASIREKYGLPEKFILSVGKLEPRKNIDRLIEAYATIRKRIGIGLVVSGKRDPAFRGYYDRVRKRGIEEDAVFTGYVDDSDLPALYSMARVFAYPSLHEGFGIPLLEAMACGTPVVTSDVSALPDVAGNAAVLVDPSSVESIAGGLARILGDDVFRAQLIESGYERARGFDAGRAAEGIVELYKKILFPRNPIC
jgi:glycosyltransferase involved in cell wall biosynthesis